MNKRHTNEVYCLIFVFILLGYSLCLHKCENLLSPTVHSLCNEIQSILKIIKEICLPNDSKGHKVLKHENKNFKNFRKFSKSRHLGHL